MAVFKSDDVIDTSMLLKSKTPHNMVGDNWYIENLQHKRNLDWEYRYNVVDIEEELEKQITYSNQPPEYSPIDVVIRSAKNDLGQDLGSDWAQISFRNLKHPSGIGYRYRFASDFSPNSTDKSIWIGLNKSNIKAGNATLIRRCNTHVNFLGVDDFKLNNVLEIHQEPCILDNDNKYTQTYYNQNVPVPQSEWYLTMQLNYYTNHIQINDRFVFSTLSQIDRGANSVFKVKTVAKSESDITFLGNNLQDELKHIALVTFGLDRDMSSPDDDYENRIAGGTTKYLVEYDKPYEGYIELDDTYNRIMLGEEIERKLLLFSQGEEQADASFEVSCQIEGLSPDEMETYLSFEQIDGASFRLKNKKKCSNNVVINANSVEHPEISREFIFNLVGFY